MPQFRLPYAGYQLNANPDDPDPIFELLNGETLVSQLFEVKGRASKTLWIWSDHDLSLELYIAPEATSPPSQWLLYKKNLTVKANDPFIYNMDEVFPYLAIKLANASGAAAKGRGWLFAQ